MTKKLMSAKRLAIFSTLSLIFGFAIFSCSKEKINNENTITYQNNLTENIEEENEILTKEYVYKDVSYIIRYDDTDETGAPLPSEDNDALAVALGDKEYFSVIQMDNLDKIYLYDNDENSEEFLKYSFENSEEIDAVANRHHLVMDFFESDHFSRERLDGAAVSSTDCRGANCCAKLIHKSDLRTVPRQGGGNWNDVISSFKIDATSLTDNARDEVFFTVFRDADFPSHRCKRVIYDLNRPILSDNQPNHARVVDRARLRNERWCWWGGRMNDDINGFALNVCKSDCDATCFKVK